MKIIVSLFFLCILVSGNTQTLITRNGYVGFFSKTPFEDIKAENHQANAVIDFNKKNIAVALLVKSFLFRKELMQEHFNENYAESDKYPKATFSGKYNGEINQLKNGLYNVSVNGSVTFHGVTKNIQVPAVMEVKGDKLFCKSNFQLLPSDFNIVIPALVKDKIAKQIDVSILLEYNLTK